MRSAQERVRRAALALELLGAQRLRRFTTSELGAAGLALPVERSAVAAVGSSYRQ